MTGTAHRTVLPQLVQLPQLATARPLEQLRKIRVLRKLMRQNVIHDSNSDGGPVRPYECHVGLGELTRLARCCARAYALGEGRVAAKELVCLEEVLGRWVDEPLKVHGIRGAVRKPVIS
jgi:hypothetical protein